MKHLTHFCNVMTPVHHLRFGMVGAGLMDDDVYVEMICDGVNDDYIINMLLEYFTVEDLKKFGLANFINNYMEG